MMKAILVHGIAPSLIDPPAGECIVMESHRMGQVGRTEEETGAGIWGRARVIDLFFSPIRMHIQPWSKADCQPYFSNPIRSMTRLSAGLKSSAFPISCS